MTVGRRQGVAGVLAVLLMAAMAAALPAGMGRYPFNGNWQLDLKASTGVPPMMEGHQTRIHLQEDARTFVVTFDFDGRQMNVSKFYLDGRPHNLPMFGETAKAAAMRAEGGRQIRLIIQRAGAQGRVSTETITFTLSADGQTIRRVSRLRGVGETRPEQVFIYRRMGGSSEKAALPEGRPVGFDRAH